MNGATCATRVPVLMYHRVDEPAGAGERRFNVAPGLFASHLDWLAEHGWRPCTIADFSAWYVGGAPLPERSLLITFDDGFAGLHRHALPRLAERGWPATVFLVSALIGGRDDWRAREFGSAGSDALLNRAQIEEMAHHRFDFQSHSRHHLDLTTLAPDALQAQVGGSRQDLEQLLGRPVRHFAYPYGRHNAAVQDAVRHAGYELAFSVNPGFNRPGQERLQVRRLDITGHDTPARFARKVALGSNDGSWIAQARYLAGRAVARAGLGARA